MTTVANLVAGWQPVRWTLIMHAGSAWHFTATLTDGGEAVTGAVLFVNGHEYPVEVGDGLVTARLEPHEVDRVTDRAPADLYLDVAGAGRVLWLTGSVTRGDL